MTATALALIFASASASFDLPPGLLSAVCYVESNHQSSAYLADDGGSPSIGVCQVKMVSAIHMGYRGSAEELQRPEVNIYYAAKYLRYQISRYNNVDRGVVAYSKGNANGLRTTAYSTKVMKTWRQQWKQSSKKAIKSFAFVLASGQN